MIMAANHACIGPRAKKLGDMELLGVTDDSERDIEYETWIKICNRRGFLKVILL